MGFDPLRGARLMTTVGQLLVKAASLGEGQDFEESMDQLEAGLAGASAYVDKKLEQKRKREAAGAR